MHNLLGVEPPRWNTLAGGMRNRRGSGGAGNGTGSGGGSDLFGPSWESVLEGWNARRPVTARRCERLRGATLRGGARRAALGAARGDVAALARAPGDIIVLGAGGKMGPTLARHGGARAGRRGRGRPAGASSPCRDSPRPAALSGSLRRGRSRDDPVRPARPRRRRATAGRTERRLHGRDRSSARTTTRRAPG